MSKPLAFSLLEGVGRLLPQPLLERALCRPLARLHLSLPTVRRMVEARWRRILSHEGRPADEAVLQGLWAESIDCYAARIATVFRYSRLRPRVAGMVDLEFLPALSRLLEAGHGAILASPHFGDLILGSLAMDEAGLPVTILILGARNFAWTTRRRVRWACLGSGAGELVAALSRNETVMVFDDWDFFPDERTADLFGAPVPAPQGAPRLALHTGAPILPVYLVREDGKHRFHGDLPILPEGRSQEALEDLLLRSMEKFIGRHPAQWHLDQDIWDLEQSRRDARRLLRRT